MLGYTVMTDSQKAAHFCTCTGCNHHSDQKSADETDFCTVEMITTAQKQNEDQEPEQAQSDGCCSSSSPASKEQSGINICQCNHDTTPSDSIAIFNTIDKTALFPSMIIRDLRLSSQSRFSFIEGISIPFLKEIFHPPK